MPRTGGCGLIPGNNRGNAAFDIVIFTALIILVILPVFSAVFEKYLLSCKVQAIKDAVDLSNISAYNAINTGNLGVVSVDFGNAEIAALYRRILSKNLNLNEDLTPKENSIAEDTVTIDSLAGYTSGFPVTCPDGAIISRPAIHGHITVPMKPGLYRRLIQELTGRQYLELEVHVDSDIPVDN